jgi:hypothetical protein
MRISVLYWMMACTESDRRFQSLSDLRQQHHAAQQHIQEGNLQEGIEDFRRLHQEYPSSRALLESLLTAELQGQADVLRAGYSRVKEVVRLNPGDGVFRLIQAKFHLALGHASLANSDLQVVLFNQQFHPWKLAQDVFLEQYKDDIDASLIPFALLQVLQVEVPERLLLGDTGDLRFSVTHLSNCEPRLSKVDLNVQVVPIRLQIQTDRIDDVVTTTKMILSVKIQNGAEQTSVPIQFTCGERSISTQLPSFSIVDIADESTVSTVGHLVIPSVQQLSSVQPSTGVYWEHYYNQVLVDKGLWTFE